MGAELRTAIRSLGDGSVEVYQYADTRAEAETLAKEANGG